MQKFLYVWVFWTVGTIGTLQSRTERSWVKLNGRLLLPPKFTQGIKESYLRAVSLLPQDLLQRSAGLCQNIECSSKLAHIMKQHSQIAVRVFWSHWHYSCIKLDRYWLNWGSFGKRHSSEILICVLLWVFAYFCGIFAHFLRGGFAPCFLILDGFGPHKAPNITKQICFRGSSLNWHSLSISASKPLKAPQDSKGCEKAFNGHVVSWVLLGHVNRPTYRHQNHCDNSQLILHDCSIFMMILPCSCRSKTF